MQSLPFKTLAPLFTALAFVLLPVRAWAQDPDAGAPPAAEPVPAASDAGAPEPAPAEATKPGDEKLTLDKVSVEGARAAGTPPPGVNASNFMDTRLTWTFGDDDILHNTGELIPLSPNFSIGNRPQYRLFFDALNSRFDGRENFTHLVLYKKMPAFIDRLTTEAAVVLRFELANLAAKTGDVNSALYDTGSYIRLFYNTTSNPKEGLSATFFPIDTNLFRVGYLYYISWGGTNERFQESIFPRIQGSSPGLKVQYDGDKFYAFAGFKTATIVQPQQVLRPGSENDVEVTRVGETNYGFLAGAGVDPIDHLRVDVSGGYFQQGRFDLEDVRGRPLYTYGGSARLVVHERMPVPQSIDFLLYRNDPTSPMQLFRQEKYDLNNIAWSVSAETAYILQHLKSFDTPGQLKDQAAQSAAVQGVVKAGYLSVSATGVYRDLNYIVRNVPGFIPFETLPSSAQTKPELFGSLAASYHIAGPRLTPGIAAGVQLPATFESVFPEGNISAQRTIVVRNQGDEAILPYNQDRSPIIQARVNLRWDIAPMLGAVLWGQLIRDNNSTLVVRDPTEGTASLRVFQSPNRFGLGTFLQARF